MKNDITSSETLTQQEHSLITRDVALQILHTVLDKNQPLDQVFDNSNGFINLADGRDRAFVKMLVTTTIRRLGQIDDLIRRALLREGQEISPPKLMHLLRLGVCQLVFMDVPNYAAVDTMVSLAAKQGLSRQKSFVNAVLRKVSREGKTWTTKQDIPRLNTPEWMLKVWSEDYGIRNAMDIAQAMTNEAALDLTVRNQDDIQVWAKRLGAQVLPTNSLRLNAGGLISQIDGFEEGAWWVQDAAAAIPAQLFKDLEGQNAADLCAAPGGKTAQIAMQGAHVTALDRSARRLVRFNENMKRLNVSENVNTEAADAGVWQPSDALDAVLLDAPCTASGTLRKRPDVAWLKTPKDLDAMAEAQRRILDNAARMLKSGGVLVYCTCSLFKAEGEAQIDAFLANHPDYSRQPITADEVGGVTEIIDENGDLRILPFHFKKYGGIDGFYAARLVKA